MLSSIINICVPQLSPSKKADVGKICLTISKVHKMFVCFRSSDVSITAKGTPLAVVLVERINTDVLNRFSEAVESQKTISVSC